jgi:hypothetical protein
MFDIEETLDVWQKIKASLVYTPDILEYASECNFIQFLEGKKSYDKDCTERNFEFLYFIEENSDILDRLYWYIVSYIKSKKGSQLFTKNSFYNWCYRYSFVYK